MGNYNKWRKLLTILLIINMCFVLFAKFSNVFAADIEVPEFNNSINIDPSFDDYNFILFFYKIGNNDYVVSFVLTDKTRNFLLYPDYKRNPDLLYMNSKGSYLQIYYRGTVSQIISYFDNLTADNLTLSSTSLDGSPSMIGTFSGLADAYNNSQIFANAPVYSFTSPDSVIVNPNVTFFNAPHFDNVTEIESGNPDGVIIEPSSYGVDDTLYFHLLEVVYTTPNSNNDTIYYYMPKIFALDKTSPYLKYYLDNKDYPYYNIPRKALGLSADSSYLYILSNSSESYNNSVGAIQEDASNGVYDVITSDTTGVFSTQQSIDDNVDNIDDFLRDNKVDDYNLNYNNNNSELTSMNNGFFSRLLSLVSDSFDYNLSDDIAISLPMPHSNKTIELHSNILYKNINGVIRTIIEAFWFYVFGFYVFRFINKLYIAISSGSILDTFSSSDEAITNNML